VPLHPRLREGPGRAISFQIGQPWVIARLRP
jgi:hypothetical protein